MECWQTEMGSKRAKKGKHVLQCIYWFLYIFFSGGTFCVKFSLPCAWSLFFYLFILFVSKRTMTSPREMTSATLISSESGMTGSSCWPFSVSFPWKRTNKTKQKKNRKLFATTEHQWCVYASSGLSLQLDWLLSVVLSDQYHRWTLRRHLRLRPLAH